MQRAVWTAAEILGSYQQEVEHFELEMGGSGECRTVSLGPNRANTQLVEVNRHDRAHDKAQRLVIPDKVAVEVVGGEAVEAGKKSEQRGNGTFAMIASAGLVLIYAMNK